MRQAWHIFKKDVLYLQREIAMYFGAILAGWWLATSYNIAAAELLVPFTAAYVIARVVQADAPAGDRQFWITRPYRWTSLLAAKLLFILALIDLPVLLAQSVILAQNGFPISSVWKGLLWEQVLWFFGLSLPVAALAALTSGLIPFVSSLLCLILVASGVNKIVELPEYSLHATEWVRASVEFGFILIASTLVVWLQYSKRQTTRSRLIAFYILAIAIVVCIFLPWPLAFAIQQRFSTQLMDPASILVRRDLDTQNWAVALSRGKRVEISVPLIVQGFPPDVVSNPEAIEITLQSDGDSARLQRTHIIPSKTLLIVRGELDRDFFNAHRDRRVTLRGSLYLTFFGNKQAYTVKAHYIDQRVPVGEKVRCILASYGFLCDSPLHWPNQRMQGAPGYATSYSPFPADLHFYPFERRWSPSVRTGDPRTRILVPDMTVEITEPVAYVRRDFEIPDIPLLDIAVPWRSQRVTGEGKSPVQNEY